MNRMHAYQLGQIKKAKKKNSSIRSMLICMALSAILYFPLAPDAFGGVIEINQENALEGNITPGDAPGFPVTISKKGFYRLTSNLTVTDANAIEVTTDKVALNLNGFAISGSPGSFQAVSGIEQSNIIVKNGSINRMGVWLGSRSHIRKVHFDASLELVGIITGVRSKIMGNTIIASEGGAIDTGDRSIVIENKVISGDGIIQTGRHSLVSRNILSDVTVGIRADNGTKVKENTITGVSGSESIRVGNRCTVRDNAVFNNTRGIIAGAGSRIIHNTVKNNGLGIDVGAYSRVFGNTVTDNFEDGITAGRGSKVWGNTVRGNSGVGLLLGDNTCYSKNVISNNASGTVSGGVEIGINLCNGSTTCP